MKKHFSLERTLLLSILIASSSVTGVLTLMSLVLDYRIEMNALRNSAPELRSGIEKPLGSLLYAGDELLIKIFAESVLASREIECVEIFDTYSKMQTKRWCDADKPVFESYSVSFPIEFEGFSETTKINEEKLGTITLTLSDKHIIEGIKDRLITFFATQASKTFIITFLILMIVRYLVTRRISRIYQYFEQYTSVYRGKALVLDDKPWVDELDTLTVSINSLLKEQEKIITLSLEKEHSYNQLAKVFYPHQLDMMKRGIQLEDTMPIGRAEAIIVAFDIIGSSKIKHANMKNFLREVFAACSEAMMKGYSPDLLHARACRIKEMGDGFLCSIGFPFRPPQGALAADIAIELAEEFVAITKRKSIELGFTEAIHCGIGIASGEIEAFFPNTLPCEYDLFGKALILATRYESARYMIFEEFKCVTSTIIMRENVYEKLSPTHRASFARFELDRWKVRDDPEARCLYYKLMDIEAMEQAS